MCLGACGRCGGHGPWAVGMPFVQPASQPASHPAGQPAIQPADGRAWRVTAGQGHSTKWPGVRQRHGDLIAWRSNSIWRARPPHHHRGTRMSAYSPPPQGPTPYGRQPGPTPYGPPPGHGGPAPYGPPATGPFVQVQQPAYGPLPVQQSGVPMFTPTGPARRPWLRPLIALGAVTVVLAGFWVLSMATDDGKPPERDARDAVAGDCLENRGTHAGPPPRSSSAPVTSPGPWRSPVPPRS